jgi:glycosyltransferase involved in cell wall biosynthesis
MPSGLQGSCEAADKMVLSIIIPTLNEEKYLNHLIESLLIQSSLHRFEIIVVDASTSTGTIDTLKPYRGCVDIKVIISAQADPGAQRNIGIRAAKYDYLLFLDADVVLERDAIERCLERLRTDEYGVVSIRHRADTNSLGVRIALCLTNVLILTASVANLPVTNGDFILTNKKTMYALGGFKEGYLLGEDTDLGYRAHEIGASHAIERRTFITASSRRLSTMPARRLVFIWASAYLRVIRGKGPTGRRTDDANYPFGKWS